MGKPVVNTQTVMIAVILLLLTLLLIQYFTPKDIQDTAKIEQRADSLARVNTYLLEAVEAAEVERAALRAEVLRQDSIIDLRNQSISNLKIRRNETSTRIDGLDNDGLIDFFTGFNAPDTTTVR